MDARKIISNDVIDTRSPVICEGLPEDCDRLPNPPDLGLTCAGAPGFCGDGPILDDLPSLPQVEPSLDICSGAPGVCDGESELTDTLMAKEEKRMVQLLPDWSPGPACAGLPENCDFSQDDEPPKLPEDECAGAPDVCAGDPIVY